MHTIATTAEKIFKVGGENMYSKLKISATIEIITGLHIGGSDTYSAIGAVSSPVIRDSLTGCPIIPGSSLKGKMRVLLSRSIKKELKPDDDPDPVKRLFGTSNNSGTSSNSGTNSNDSKSSVDNTNNKTNQFYSRLQFWDAFLINLEELKEVGLTEVKFENTINRSNSKANPRQIERVIRGAKFAFVLTYDAVEENEIIEDFENIAKAIILLQLDYLGGHGTRGYGRVAFSGFNVECVAGEIDYDTLEAIKELLKKAEYSPDLSM